MSWDEIERYEQTAAAFYAATGMLAPGKDQAAALGDCPTLEERQAAWKKWRAERREEKTMETNLNFKQFATLETRRRDLDAELKRVKSQLDALQPQVQTEFQTLGIQSVNVDGLTLYLHRILTTKAANGDRGAVAVALKAHDDTAFMVTEGFNTNTLSGWVRELERDGEGNPILPQHLQGKVEVGEVFSIRARSAGKA